MIIEKHRLIFLLFALLITSMLHAQSNFIDSLSDILETQSNDSSERYYSDSLFYDSSSEMFYTRRIVWRGGEHAWRYNVEIDKSENGRFQNHLRQFTTSLYIDVSLLPGEYRIRIIPHDILDRPSEGTQWMNFQILHISGINETIVDSSEIENEQFEIINFDTLRVQEIIQREQVRNNNDIEPSALPIEMVWVPGGSFTLGRDIETQSSYMWSSTVTLTGFYIGKYTVTQEQYQAVMGSNPSYFNGSRGREPAAGEVQERRPVEMVNWYSAIVFCNRLSLLEGLTPVYRINGSTNPSDWGAIPVRNNRIWNAVEIVYGSTGYRLPTEAQWEFAAKSGNNASETTSASGGWHFGNSSAKTREVGRRAPNGLGIYDMNGNVWEWCWDWHGRYTRNAKTDPTGPASGGSRVQRGGSWFYSALGIHSIFRFGYHPSGRDYDIGFRVVRP